MSKVNFYVEPIFISHQYALYKVEVYNEKGEYGGKISVTINVKNHYKYSTSSLIYNNIINVADIEIEALRMCKSHLVSVRL